ncbi:MAG: hypothetical protein P8X70_03585 [Nanoarchaeota archaeon]
MGNLCIGKVEINGRKSFILEIKDNEAVVLEKYLGEGLQKVKYGISEKNKFLKPTENPEIIYEFHKDYDYFKSLYDGRIID